jgi:hypothetical protein
MTTRDEITDRVWLALNRHAPVEIVATVAGSYVRCQCQPLDSVRMDMPTWHRHVAEHAAEAASQLNR